VIEIACDAFGMTPGIFKIDAKLSRRGAIDAYDWKPRQYLIKVLGAVGQKVRECFIRRIGGVAAAERSANGAADVLVEELVWLSITTPERMKKREWEKSMEFRLEPGFAIAKENQAQA